MSPINQIDGNVNNSAWTDIQTNPNKGHTIFLHKQKFLNEKTFEQEDA